uniref:TIL domain-containing protein n=2 Tax=Phlebotomus papatasi TaxID=29031 RepID=A0A1B0D7N2_PHLPP
PSCPKHEEYLFCGEAPPCQVTCENYGRSCDVKPSSYCPQGCYCKHGYARHPITNQCVHVKNCPSIEYFPQKAVTTTTTTTTTPKPEESCGKNEEYMDCGPSCQVDCSTLGQDCPKSSKKCTSGCFCKHGYVRDGPGGECIAQRNCPDRYCPKNEVWLVCGQAPACQETCDGVDYECEARKDSRVCPSGCYCRRGYVRHPTTGLCIRKRDCPSKQPQCGYNEQYQECGYRCVEQCKADSKQCKYEKCESGCFCKEGYARINGQCVPFENCAQKCPPNEQYYP